MIPKQLRDLSFCRIKKGNKAPFEKDWNNKPYSYDEISKFFPKENYGVLCGYHDLAVIDCDKRPLALVVEQLLPETFSVKTGGGGTHFYFFIPELKQKYILNLGEDHHGEIQFKGQQVVGGGSLHPNGKTYEIIKNVGIKTITLDKLRGAVGQFMEKEKISLDKKENIEEHTKLINELVKKWKEGDRQELALSVSGYLRKKGLGINKIKSIIEEVCVITDDEELKMRLRAVDETFKKDEKEVKGFTGLKEIDLGEPPRPEEFTYKEIVKGRGGEEKEIIKVSIDKIADYLMEIYIFKTIYGVNNEKVFLFEDGIYILKGKEMIKTEVENLLKTKARTNIVNEVYEKIKRKTAISKETFHSVIEGLVCLENGIYDLKNNKFIEHSPEYYFKSKLPIEYNIRADCPNIKKFFGEILYEEDLLLIQEWLGFNLYNLYFEKKAVILFGEKDTGKTITLNLFSHFIGEKNKVSLSLQKIAYGKTFDLLDLKDKYSNIYDDLGDKDINDAGGFKIATGGGTITGEEKFGDRIDFKTYAKLTFATNKIPPIKDMDDTAYYSRWMPIAFDNQIKPEDQDKFLLEKLTTKEEISGLFLWAIEGLKRLIENNGFSFKKTSGEIKQIMQRSSHPLSAFAEDCLEQADGEKITKEEMYRIYSEWCKKRTKARFTKDKLGKNLERFVPYIISLGGVERVWLNVVSRETMTAMTPSYNPIESILPIKKR